MTPKNIKNSMKEYRKLCLFIAIGCRESYSTLDTIENSNSNPTIDTITGDITGKKGEIITIHVTFSDNIEVTNATIYYRTATIHPYFFPFNRFKHFFLSCKCII